MRTDIAIDAALVLMNSDDERDKIISLEISIIKDCETGVVFCVLEDDEQSFLLDLDDPEYPYPRFLVADQTDQRLLYPTMSDINEYFMETEKDIQDTHMNLLKNASGTIPIYLVNDNVVSPEPGYICGEAYCPVEQKKLYVQSYKCGAAMEIWENGRWIRDHKYALTRGPKIVPKFPDSESFNVPYSLEKWYQLPELSPRKELLLWLENDKYRSLYVSLIQAVNRLRCYRRKHFGSFSTQLESYLYMVNKDYDKIGILLAVESVLDLYERFIKRAGERDFL